MAESVVTLKKPCPTLATVRVDSSEMFLESDVLIDFAPPHSQIASGSLVLFGTLAQVEWFGDKSRSASPHAPDVAPVESHGQMFYVRVSVETKKTETAS